MTALQMKPQKKLPRALKLQHVLTSVTLMPTVFSEHITTIIPTKPVVTEPDEIKPATKPSVDKDGYYNKVIRA